MKLTLYLLFGSAFILVGIFALYVSAGAASSTFLELEARCSRWGLQRGPSSPFYVGFGILAGSGRSHWSPDGHASAPTAFDAPRGVSHEARGVRGRARGDGALPTAPPTWCGSSADDA